MLSLYIFDTSPRAFSQEEISKRYFPIWQLIFSYGQLPKCAIYKALGPLVFLAAVLGNCIFIYIVKHSCTHAGS